MGQGSTFLHTILHLAPLRASSGLTVACCMSSFSLQSVKPKLLWPNHEGAFLVDLAVGPSLPPYALCFEGHGRTIKFILCTSFPWLLPLPWSCRVSVRVSGRGRGGWGLAQSEAFAIPWHGVFLRGSWWLASTLLYTEWLDGQLSCALLP